MEVQHIFDKEYDDETLPDMMDHLYEEIDKLPKDKHGFAKGKYQIQVIFFPYDEDDKERK